MLSSFLKVETILTLILFYNLKCWYMIRLPSELLVESNYCDIYFYILIYPMEKIVLRI